MHTTSSQTIGPYLHIGMTWLVDEKMAVEGVSGQRITLTGRMIDADGTPVNDAMVEIWQANSHGRYHHPDDTRELPLDQAFSGFGRVYTDEDGRFRFHTIKPGRVPGPDGTTQAPHIAVSVFARGLLDRVVTRIYFADEAAANTADPLLAGIDPAAAATLIAQPVDGGYRFDVHLQGPDETAFFAI